MLFNKKEFLMWIKGKPKLSVWMAGWLLSGAWLFFWLIVFFASTWILGIETGAQAFILAFWLSVSAEAVIRWVENTDFIAALSKPHDDKPTGDNQNYSAQRAGLICLVQFFVISIYVFLTFQMPDIFTIGENAAFKGQIGRSSKEAYVMFANWQQTITINTVLIAIFTGSFFRALIYKREHDHVKIENKKKRKPF